MRPYVLLFTVYGLSINRPLLALSLFPSLALSICVIFCCNATCEHCEQRVFLHCSFVNFMYFWCAIFNRMRKRRRKMLTLNLIGIWNDGRPCTRQIGRSRWSNRFTLLLLALTFLCFDFFNSLLNRYREQWTRWDSDFLDRWKFRSNVFSRLCSRIISKHEEMIDQWIVWNFERFNTTYCGNILFWNGNASSCLIWIKQRL